MELTYQTPKEIEARSFELIEEQLQGVDLPEPQRSVLRRVIHTTADFDYAETLRFSHRAAERGIEALSQGAHLVTDTSMAYAGIHKAALRQLGGEAHCFIADPDVAEQAESRGITRSAAAMEKACTLQMPLIFAIGNAPTALIRLEELIRSGRVSPKLVIGVPVGFVNVVESKEFVMAGTAPYIVAQGRKGGSNVAAAICNALLYSALQGKE